MESAEDQETIPKIWRDSENYLNTIFASHQFTIIPLSLTEMKKKIQHNELDFIILNPMLSIQLSQTMGISRIATISQRYKDHFYSEYGSVIFTKSGSKINQYSDLYGKKIGAVSPHSFGGYLLGKKEIGSPMTEKNTLFLETHYKVVKAVLEGRVDAGIIRSNVLEKMQDEGIINLNDIKVLNAKKHLDFPFLVSTNLYPEWVLAKTPHTSEYLTNETLSTLLKLSITPKATQIFKLTPTLS